MFEVHGWQELGVRLHVLSLEGRWQEMVALVPDAMAEEFATVGHVDEIGEKLRERWGGILDTINLPTDFPLATREDERRARGLIEALRRSISKRRDTTR